MNCPPTNELLDYARGLTADQARAAINAHLQTGCGGCSENLRWFHDVAALTAQDRSFEFPEETIKGLVTWFKSQPTPAPRTLRKLIAQLIFDSLAPQQLAPVRSEAATGFPNTLAAGRQMLFQTEGYDIDLRFEAIEDKPIEDLIGQILPQSEAQAVTAGAMVELRREESEQMRAQTDEQGLFRFTRIPSGVYDVTIQIAEDEINIARISSARTELL